MTRHPAHYLGPVFLGAIGALLLLPAALVMYAFATLPPLGYIVLTGDWWIPLGAMPVAALSFFYGAWRWWQQP